MASSFRAIARRRRIRVVPLMILLIHMSGWALGTTYYVSTAGSYLNSGTSTNEAWRRIQWAVEHVGPGDTIIVMEGTYKGATFDETRGTAGSPITLKAQEGAHVILNEIGPRDAQQYHKSILLFEGWESGIAPCYWIVEGFEVTAGPRDGIDIRGFSVANPAHHITVRNNYVHHNTYRGIISIYANDLIIEGNETAYNGLEHGIYCGNAGDRPIIRNNISHHNKACGIHLNADGEIIEDALIEGNIIYQNGSGGGSAINLDGVIDSVIQNNLIYDNLAHGISLFKIDGAVPTSNCRIYNNTILLPVERGSKGEGWGINISGANAVSNKVYGNIIYNARGSEGSINVRSSSLEGFESDYNVIDGKFSTDGYPVSTVISFSEWQALGYDTHSFISTPSALFVDPGADNYQLKVGSPAIDGGIALSGVTNDLAGVSRPQGDAFDLGAYEKMKCKITATAASEGFISPIGDVYLDYGDGTNFLVKATNHYHISSISSNGVVLAEYSYNNWFTNIITTWSNLTADGEIHAEFRENYWLNVPETWLEKYYAGTNDYENAAGDDTDQDGLKTWEEYVAGTDPTRGDSTLKIIEQGSAAGCNYIKWVGGTNLTGRSYQVYRLTDITGFWDLQETIEEPTSVTNIWWDTGVPPDSPVFYRVAITNSTPAL